MLESCKLSCKQEEKSSFKTTLWECFGGIIVSNLKNNLTKDFKYNAIQCKCCGKLIEAKTNRTKYCDECCKSIEQENNRRYAREKIGIKLIGKKNRKPLQTIDTTNFRTHYKKSKKSKKCHLSLMYQCLWRFSMNGL